MKSVRFPVTPIAALTAAVVVLSLACGPAPEEPAPAATATEPAAEDVEYEPAYPDEVSAEGLSADDTEQQGEHTHADGTSHSHDGDDDHDDHDDEDGNHDH